MQLKNNVFLILALSLLLPSVCFGLSVTAHVDKTTITHEDSIYLTIEVSGGKAVPDVSGITDFRVISQGSSSSFNFINGRSERKAGYQYALMPLAKGKLKIPAIKVQQGGSRAFTKEIIIHVKDRVPDSDKVKSIFARASVTKKKLVTGEQAVYSLQFFTSKRITGARFETPPAFKGFSSQSFDQEKNSTRTINGVQFHVTQLDYIIIPSSAGTFTIDPVVLIAKVVVRSGFNDTFFFSDRSKPVRVVSNPVQVTVSPLPPYQGTGRFSGLVGVFDIESAIDKTTLKAGESATLTVKISGTGNIMDAAVPQVLLDDETFKVYDDAPVEAAELGPDGYHGHKIFKKALVPVHPGKFEISPVALTYFDVDKNAYETRLSDSFFMDVEPSDKIHVVESQADSQTSNRVQKKEVMMVNRDILEIKDGMKALKQHRPISFPLFSILLAAPGALFLCVMFFAVIKQKTKSHRKEMSEKAARHFKTAMQKKKQGKDFLGEVYAGLHASILTRTDKKAESITSAEARDILEDAGIAQSKIDEMILLLEQIESIRFGGKLVDQNAAGNMLDQAEKMIKMIKMMCLAIICMGLFSGIPRDAAADATAVFTNAVNAYDAGSFSEAAQTFESIAMEGINNPYLFYNIGNAYLKAEDIGRAVLWYERALKINPGDPDLNFNLAHARGRVKDKIETSVQILDVLFFWESIISFKTVQITAITLSIVFFCWAGVQVILQKRVFSGIGILLSTLFAISSIIVLINFYQHSIKKSAVILASEVQIRSGTAESSTPLFTLHAGTTVRVLETRNKHLKIRFSKGKIGWVGAEAAEII